MKDIYLIPNKHIQLLNEDMLIEEVKRLNELVRQTIGQLEFITSQLKYAKSDIPTQKELEVIHKNTLYVLANVPKTTPKYLIPSQTALSIINKNTLKYE
jgi:hypothetical protein